MGNSFREILVDLTLTAISEKAAEHKRFVDQQVESVMNRARVVAAKGEWWFVYEGDLSTAAIDILSCGGLHVNYEDTPGYRIEWRQ